MPGMQLPAPIMVDFEATPRSTVEAPVGKIIVLTTTTKSAVTRWTATVSNPQVVAFAPGYSDGSAIFNPSLTGLSAGTSDVTLTDPQSGDSHTVHVTITDSPADSMTDTAAQTTQFAATLIGMPEETAVGAAAAAGYTTRISTRDGESFPMTMDYRPDRINLDITAGAVVSTTVG